MENNGQISPSKPNLNINFETKNNDNNILNLLKKFQNVEKLDTFFHAIFQEDNAPYILINTNLCRRPLKLLIDTGASLSIISNEIISKNSITKNCQINLYGLNGKEKSIQTNGIINGTLFMEKQYLNVNFHIVDKKYTGKSDGFLGYDFYRHIKHIST